MTELDTLERQTREVQIMFSVVHRLGMQAMHQHLTAHGNGISPLQFGMMRMLSMQDMTLSDLSRKFQLDPSTLVPSIAGLVHKRLIQRARDPNDRRRQPLKLTEEGETLLRLIPFRAENDPLRESLNTMGEEKTQQLIALMRELINNMPDGDSTLCDIQDRVALQEQRIKHG